VFNLILENGTLLVEIITEDYKDILKISSSLENILKAPESGYYSRLLGIIRESGIRRAGRNVGITIVLNLIYTEPYDIMKRITQIISTEIGDDKVMFTWMVPVYDNGPLEYDKELEDYFTGIFIGLKFLYGEKAGRVATIAARSRLFLGGDYSRKIGRKMTIINRKGKPYFCDYISSAKEDPAKQIILVPLRFSLIRDSLKGIWHPNKGRSIGSSYHFSLYKGKISETNINAFFEAINNQPAFNLDYLAIKTSILEV